MIKTAINSTFPHLHANIVKYDKSIFVTDYTEKTKLTHPKRAVEIFSPHPCTDNECFELKNNIDLEIDTIILDNNSFKYSNGLSKSQCETTVFPSTSLSDSWFLLLELKYSNKPVNNASNLKKAIKQLFKTRYHYIQENVISNKNTQYLIASLPMQSEPFLNFSLTPAYLLKLKTKRNIILRLKNDIEIIDNQLLSV